jgi:hypothetical protein
MKQTDIKGDMLRHYRNLLNDEKVMRIKELWVDEKLGLSELYLEMVKDYEELTVHTLKYQKHKPVDFNTQGHVLISAAMLYYKDYDVSEWIRYKKKYMESEAEQKAFDDLHKNLS